MGRFFARVPFIIEIETDYASAVKLALALQEKAIPVQPQTTASSTGEPSEKTFEWKLENGAFSVTYKMLPGNILFSNSRGTFKTADEVREFKNTLDRVLREWIKPGNEYFRIMEWTGFKYASMKARSLYVNYMKELQKEFPCKLAVLYGMSPFARAALTISKHFLSTIRIMTAANYDDGLSKIRSFASSQRTSPADESH